MTYKEFKKKLIDLDITNKEFCSIFNIHHTTLSKSNKDNISNMLCNYIILLEEYGVDSVKRTMNNK